MAKKTKMGKSLPGAYLYGGKVIITGLVVAMFVPFAHDLYKVTKGWLLKEEETQDSEESTMYWE